MNEKFLKSLFVFLGAIFLLLFCVTPFLWMLTISMSANPDFLTSGTSLHLTLQNYTSLLSEKTAHLLQYLVNSIVVSTISAFFATLFASLSAYAITRTQFPGRKIIPILMLAFSLFPQISIVGYLFKLMVTLRWINTYWALIFPYIALGLPLALWIMLSYFSQLPVEFDHAAKVDGATRFQTLRKIIVPIALPGLVSTMLLVFIYSFNEFLFAYLLTTDYKARTIPVGIALFEGLHGQIPWGQIMAAAAIATLPLIILALIFQRYIIQGLTQGAIKG